MSKTQRSSCGRGRQLAEDQQVGDLEEGGALAELLDRVAAVFEDAGGAVDVGDRGAAGGGVGEGRVVGHQPEFVLVDLDLPQVEAAHGPVLDRQLVGLAGAVVGDGQRVGGRSAAVDSACCSVAVAPPRLVKRRVAARCAVRPRGGGVELRHPPQRLEALVDLLAAQPRDPLGPELLDVEGGEHGAVAHRPPQVGLVEVAVLAVEVAEEAAGEAVAGAGRVAHLLQREAGQGEEAVLGEERGAVLALLGDHRPRPQLHHRAGGPGQVGLAGQLADLGVVDDQAVDLGDRRPQRVPGGLDPEVHRVEAAEVGAALGADLALQVGLDVGEEEGVGGLRALRELRLELGEDAEPGVLGVGDVEVVLVAAAPEEGLAARHPLDVVGEDAALLEHGELLGRRSRRRPGRPGAPR